MKLIDACKGNKPAVTAIERAIRKMFRYSANYMDTLDKSISTKVGVRGGRRYDCGECGGDFPRKEVEVDHTEPVVPLDSSLSEVTLERLYERIFSDMSNLKVLCKICHKAKSKKEAGIRAKYRRAKKND